jgi:nucleoside-diphosphate-sugar epimerase
MRVLLTGATGFVGNNVESINSALFRCVVRTGEKFSFSNSYLISDLSEYTNWDDAFTDCRSVIHLAGLAHSHSYSEKDYRTVNVDGTLHFASEAAKAGVKRFVFVSSIGVNGTKTNQLVFSTTSDVNPHNAYAQSKYDAEVGLKRIAEETGLEVVIVRPTLVYGLNAPGNFGSLTKLVQKFPFLPFGLSDNKRDFIAVQNLADLLLTCSNHPNAAGHTFLASDGETVSIKVFTNAIAKGLNKTLIQLPVPISLMRLGARLVGKLSIAEQLLGNLQVDSSNAHEVLGWSPPYTMEQAMASLSESKK